MIAKIQGHISETGNETVLVEVGAISYEVMVPVCCLDILREQMGKEVTLCTMEYYEGTPGGGNLIPRLVGFLSRGQRDFFTKFTSVKGVGIKRGLRSLNLPIEQVAAAIEMGNEKVLCTLPGIGKRMSQQIIAELRGKVGLFAGESDITVTAVSEQKDFSDFQAEALEILIAWGEKRNEAMEMVRLACEKHPDVVTAEELVPLVYRIKQGIEI